MRIAGAWSWRIVVIAAASAVVVWGLSKIQLVVVPVLLATLLCAVLLPLVNALTKRRVPRGLAIAVAMVALIAGVVGLIWLAVYQLRKSYPELQQKAFEFWESTRVWLLESPLHLDQDAINSLGQDVVTAIRADAPTLISSALSFGSTAGQIVAGLLLTLFATLFFLLDGQKIWRWVHGFFPAAARATVGRAACVGWVTLGNFMRVQVLVAAIDAVGIGLGARLIGVPLAVPIGILVFLGSFVPIIGAIVTGTLAVLIALISLGPVKALIMLGIVLAVQQIESHVLQPFIMGSAVSVHPLGVVLAVTTGSIVAGIPGALFAVPVAAFVNAFIRSIVANAGHRRPDPSSDPSPGDHPVETPEPPLAP